MSFATPGTTGEVIAYDGSAWSAQIVDRVKESGGTTLTLGTVADTSLLVRDGTAIKGGIQAWALGVNTTTKAALNNTTAATAGEVSQESPILELSGQFWKGAANTTEKVGLQCKADVSYSRLSFLASHDGGAYSESAYFSFAAGASATLVCKLALIGLGSAGGITTDRVTVAADITPGAAARITFTNTTAAAGSTAAVIGNVPAGLSGTCAGWVKFYIANTPAYFPYWTA